MRHMHIADRLFNQPLMISEAKLNAILHVFSQRVGLDVFGLPPQQAVEISDRERRRAGYTVKNGIGIIGVYGALMHRRLDMEFPSGGPTTYAEIKQAFDTALADDGVQGIVFDYDTPGGEVNGVFDLSDHIYSSRGIKPIDSIVNEGAYSAGYLLASSGDRIILPRTAGVGSIGVIATHTEYSKWEEETGISVTHIYAGDRKADFSPHHPLSSEAAAVLQEMVNDNYDLFVETVARNRGMSTKAVRETEAGIFRGKKAVTAKLADKVSAADKAIATARKGKGTRLISASTQSMATRKENRMDTVEELRTNNPDLVAQIETEARAGMIAQSDADAALATAVTTESGRIMALVTAAVGEEASTRISAAASKGLTAEDLQALGVDLAAKGNTTAEQMLTQITAAASSGVQTGAGGEQVATPAIDTAAIYANRQKAVSG